MGWLDGPVRQSKSIEELEDDLDSVSLRSQIASQETEIAEKKAIMAELKSKYGSNWKSILGLKGIPSLPTLKSMMGGLSNPRLAKAANNEIQGGNSKHIRQQMLSGGSKLRR